MQTKEQLLDSIYKLALPWNNLYCHCQLRYTKRDIMTHPPLLCEQKKNNLSSAQLQATIIVARKTEAVGFFGIFNEIKCLKIRM